MKNIARLYLDSESEEDSFEPVKKIRKIWVRRPETKIKDKDHYNRRKLQELDDKQLLETV